MRHLPGQADTELCPSASTIARGAFDFQAITKPLCEVTDGGCSPPAQEPQWEARAHGLEVQLWKLGNAFKEMLGRHLQPSQHSAKNQKGAVKLPCRGGEALEPVVAPYSQIRAKGILFQRASSGNRNSFVDADIKQIYETEMACSSSPPRSFLNASLHRGCAFVYDYFFFCILILLYFR